LGEGKAFLGEAEVLEQPHFTISEPIITDGRVIGILYVGVNKTAINGQGAQRRSVATLKTMSASVLALKAATHAQVNAGRQTVAQRQNADNARRRGEVVGQISWRRSASGHQLLNQWLRAVGER